MIKRWLWFLLVLGLMSAGIANGEEGTGEVSGDDRNDVVYFLNGQDYSYTLSAKPIGGWFFTSEFSYPSSNGWYKSGSYSATCERLERYYTAFIDSATAFSATISGTMYKPGPGPGSPISWSVRGEDLGSPVAFYYIIPLTAILPVGGAETETFYYYYGMGVRALSGCWKIASVTSGGGEWLFYQGNSMIFPANSSYAPGEYIITAARNTRGDRAENTGPVRLVGVQKVEATYTQPSAENPEEQTVTTVTSTTDNPGSDQTIYIPIGKSVTITATPNPSGTWPENQPTWKINNSPKLTTNGLTYVGSSITFSSNTPGEYLISAHCGTGAYSTKAVKVVVIRLKLKFIDFSGSGNHTIRKGAWGTPWTQDRFDNDGGIGIDYDEWQDDDLNGTPEINEPVCYTKNQHPQLTATVAIEPKLSGSVVAILKVQYGTTPTTANITLSGSQATISNLNLAAVLPNYVANIDYALTWSFSLNNGGNYSNIGSSTNKFFVVYEEPTGTAATAKRLDWCTLKANELSTPEAIADKIWAGVASETLFSYTDNIVGWSLLDEKKKGGDCDNQATCMTSAMQLLGITAEVKGVYASTDAGANNCLVMESKVENGVTWNLVLDFTTTGNTHTWNQYEGCSNTVNHFYAITPKEKELNDYAMLTKLECRQYWATIFGNFGGEWGVINYQGPIAIP